MSAETEGAGWEQYLAADPDDREPERGASKLYGRKVEEWACERWGFERFETGYSDLVVPYDHAASDRDAPAGETSWPGDRRVVQAKGARLVVKRGDRKRPGRFRLWETDHEQLVAENALYLFVAYDPNDREPIEHRRFIPARELAEAVDGLNWYDDTSHAGKQDRPTDLSVRHVFPDL